MTYACLRDHAPGDDHHAYVRGTSPLGSTFGGPANWSHRQLATAVDLHARCCCGWDVRLKGPLHADVVQLHARWAGHFATKALVPAVDFTLTRRDGWMRRRYSAVAELRRPKPATCAAPDSHLVWTGGGWSPARSGGDPFRTLLVTATYCDHDVLSLERPTGPPAEPADLLELLAQLEATP